MATPRKPNKPSKPKPFNIFTKVGSTRKAQNSAYKKLLRKGK